MIELIRLFVCFLAAMFRSRAALQAENLALRHQLLVYQRSIKRPKVQPADRILWSLLARAWKGWKEALVFVKPQTVIRWQRRRFKEPWTRLSRSGESGRPPVPGEVKELIRTMSSMNPTWSSPRIAGEFSGSTTGRHQRDADLATRNPITLFDVDAEYCGRFAVRALSAGWYQLPPRTTRPDPESGPVGFVCASSE